MNAKQASSSAETEMGTEPARPFWIPPGIDFDALPEELKAAITGLINPAYQELVLEAEDGLSRSSGMTIVFLMWLEVLDQIQLGAELVNAAFDEATQRKREALIARYMRTTGAKNKTSNLLIRIYEFRQKGGAFASEPDPLRGNIPR